MKRVGVVIILILAFCGIADSAYIAEHEVNAISLLCDSNSLSGCNVVAANSHASLFGIPVAEYSVLFYSVLFVLAAIELFALDTLLRRTIQVISLLGFLASLYFTLVQVFVINAFCIYCLVSALIAILILIFASFIEPLQKIKAEKPLVLPPPAGPPRLLMPPSA